MINIKKYNDLLYNLKYEIGDEKRYLKLWRKLIINNILLRRAIEENCIYICEAILIFYNSVNKNTYQLLIDKIYSNHEFATTKVGDNTLLLLTLINQELQLNDLQKEYVVDKAIKEENEIYGLKYWILKNKNWPLEIKRELIYNFFNNKNWDFFLDELEEKINVFIIKKNSKFNLGLLYEYNYNDITLMISDRSLEVKIWQEIELLRFFHSVRPQQWELGNTVNEEDKIYTYYKM